MSVQTTYLDNIPVAVAGQIANMVPATLISRNVEDAAGIGFGLAVAQGTEDYGCKAFGSGDTAILGITVRDRSLDANTPDEYADGDTARIMTKGCIWVTASVAVDAGDPVYVIPATGAFAKTNASSAVQIAGARWDTSTTGAGLAIVRLG
jgi:hypothetical protein